MKVLVTGAKGQLGYDLMAQLKQRGHEAIGVDIQEMDITNQESVEQVMRQVKPDAVIHCAAYTAVDKAEDDVSLCTKINVDGTGYIAKMCQELDCKLLYLSTDYVFPGDGENFWEPDDAREPLNVYGKTKCEGELLVEEYVQKYFIVRISWVFGINGKNFVRTMLNLAQNHSELTVVNDQIGSPTYTYDLSRLLIDMIETDKYGRYHASNEGICSWYDFACEIFKQAKLDVRVLPVSSEEYPSKAKRPLNSRLSKEKLTVNGFKKLPTWQDALSRYLSAMQAQEVK